jgi:hypothetical protein
LKRTSSFGVFSVMRAFRPHPLFHTARLPHFRNCENMK